MSKHKEVAKQENKVLVSGEMEAWGQEPSQLSAQDLIIAKILPIQMMSKKNAARTAAYGEFRDTVNNELFGKLNEPFEFVPFMWKKFFIECELIKVGNKEVKEFLQILPIQSNPTQPGYNDELPYEETIGTAKIVRDRVMEFYGIIPSKVDPKMADEGGGTVPYVVKMSRTSLRAGKKIATQMDVTNRSARLAPAAAVMEISAIDTAGDEGTYIVQDAARKRASTPEELKAAFFWYKQLSQKAYKVDQSDLEDENLKRGSEEPTEF